MWYSPIESLSDQEVMAGGSRCRQESATRDNRLLEEVSTEMKLTDRHIDVIIGVILGATLGLHYPLDTFKLLFVVLSVVGVLKLAVK